MRLSLCWLMAAATVLFFRLDLAAADLSPFLLGKRDSIQPVWQVVVRGQVAYVANDIDGLQILNVFNPANPVRLSGITNDEPTLGVALGTGPTADYAFVASGGGGVDVLNVSDPINPQLVTNLLDEIVEFQANAVLVSPSGLYLYIADDSSGLKIVDISSPTIPGSFTLVGGCSTEGTAQALIISPNNANMVYVADGEAGLTRVNTANKSEPFIPDPGNVPLDYGYAWDLAANQNNVFLACADGGMMITDDSFRPDLIPPTYYPTAAEARGVLLQGSALFLACSEAGVEVLNITNPRKPARFGGFFAGGYGYEANDLAQSGTNFYLATAGLQIINTNLPSNPQRVGNYTPTNEYFELADTRAVGVTANYALLSDDNFGFLLLNVTNPASPKLLTNFPPNFTAATPNSIAIVSNFAYLAEGNSGLEILDVSVLTNPVVTVLDLESITTASIVDTPGSAFDVAVEGNYAYVADGGSGLRVIDVTDPYAAFDRGNKVTGGFANGLAVSNGYVYMADGGRGLAIFDVSDPDNPLAIGNADTPGNANDVALSGRYAFVADGGIGLSVVDISDPFHPQYKAGLNTGDTATGIAVMGDYAYVADWFGCLLVIDIRSPLSPRRVSENLAFYAPYNVRTYNNRVYIAAGDKGMQILPPFRPVQFNPVVNIQSNTARIKVSGPTGQVFRIQRSSSLGNGASWSDWLPVSFSNGNPIELTDTNYPANARRFYRAISP